MASPSSLVRRWRPTRRLLAASSFAVVAGVVLLSESGSGDGFERLFGNLRLGVPRDLGQRIDASASVVPDPVDGVCTNALPYANMIDPRPDVVLEYETYLKGLTRGRKPDRQPPELRTLPEGSSFAIWASSGCEPKRLNGYKGKCDIRPMASAWSPDGEDVLLSDSNKPRFQNWVPHQHYEHLNSEENRGVIVVDGDAAGSFGFLPDYYGHAIHDVLPMVAYMREALPDQTKFLLPDTAPLRRLLDFIDPTFVRRVIWLKNYDIVRVRSGSLTVPVMKGPDVPRGGGAMGPVGSGIYNHVLVPYLRRWIAEMHPRNDVPRNEERTVLYYRRRGNANTRVIEENHEQDVLATIRRYMEEYNIPGELVFFSGHNPDNGEIMSVEEQAAFFRQAKFIIGPHGTGLANVIWTDPAPGSCEDRVKMLEFIAAEDSKHVHYEYHGHYSVLGAMPIDWNQIAYASNSTEKDTYIRIPDLENGLRELFGGAHTVDS
mmetsp:Transcript_18182/g.52530  ORF Transcript_18182/g.52530 Transcript_18182/m.52530 type:complete len:488 (-) Transcript_18182:62-1525(-)